MCCHRKEAANEDSVSWCSDFYCGIAGSFLLPLPCSSVYFYPASLINPPHALSGVNTNSIQMTVDVLQLDLNSQTTYATTAKPTSRGSQRCCANGARWLGEYVSS